MGWACTAAFSAVRGFLHRAPVEDPSAAKLSGALGPAATAVRICLLNVRHIFRVSLASIQSVAFTNQPRLRMHGGDLVQKRKTRSLTRKLSHGSALEPRRPPPLNRADCPGDRPEVLRAARCQRASLCASVRCYVMHMCILRPISVSVMDAVFTRNGSVPNGREKLTGQPALHSSQGLVPCGREDCRSGLSGQRNAQEFSPPRISRCLGDGSLVPVRPPEESIQSRAEPPAELHGYAVTPTPPLFSFDFSACAAAGAVSCAFLMADE